jgi:hypothetical protein
MKMIIILVEVYTHILCFFQNFTYHVRKSMEKYRAIVIFSSAGNNNDIRPIKKTVFMQLKIGSSKKIYK